VNDSGPGHGSDEVGSVAEEAAKLIGVLSGWAREHGEGLSAGFGHGLADVAHGAFDAAHGLADAAHGVTGAAHNIDEHFATGSEECTYCPVCRGVHFVRSASPEVKAHLATAASSLFHAAAALMAAQATTHEGSGRRSSTVEHIDLDGDAGWPDEEEDDW
jgi:hypothetical protein